MKPKQSQRVHRKTTTPPNHSDYLTFSFFSAAAYWLDQHVVLSKQKRSSGVLVQRLHIFLRPHERTVVHAAAGLSLLDLDQENKAPHITFSH